MSAGRRRGRPAAGARRAQGPAVPHEAYPLRTVSALTGLSPDIIRAWEKRYAVVAPIRGARGARLYATSDIERLRLLARVVGAGRAIGDVARLDRAELERLAEASASGPDKRREGLVDRVIDRVEAFDHAAAAGLLGDALVGLGARAFVHEVAAPLLDEVGERWSRGSLTIADEHLCSVTVRNLLVGLIQRRSGGASRSVVLATPAGERHELGLLLVAVLTLEAGLDLTYLGSDLPAGEIVAAVRRSQAALLGLSLVSASNRTSSLGEVRAIENGLPRSVELWLGGRDAPAVAAGLSPSRSLVLDTLGVVEAELLRVARAASVRTPG